MIRSLILAALLLPSLASATALPARKSPKPLPAGKNVADHIVGDDINGLLDATAGSFHAKNYGCVGNGIADDTACLQAAIDAAYGAGGGTVLLAGKYRITAGLQLKYAVTLYNPAGQAERSNTNNKSAAGIYCSGSGYDAITIGTAGQSASAMQAGVKGIAIFDAPQNGIVVNSHGATIEGASVVHAKGHGIVMNSGTTNVLNTHVIGPGKSCFYVQANDNRIGAGSECQQPNSAYGGASEPLNTWDGIYIKPGVGALQIYNIRMGDDAYRSRDCIRADYTTQNGGTIQIVNSDLQNCTIAGVRMLGGNTLSITGTNIGSASLHADKAGIVIGTGLEPAKHVAISGNTFNGIVAGGIGAIWLDAGTTSVTISGNSFFGNWAGAWSVVGSLSGVVGYEPKILGALNIDLPNVPANTCAADQSVSVSGAVYNSECVVGMPSSALAGLQATCFVESSNTVTLRVCNNASVDRDPPPGTYNVRVLNR